MPSLAALATGDGKSSRVKPAFGRGVLVALKRA
jgi:hypothetical protein